MSHFHWEIIGSIIFFLCFGIWLWSSNRQTARPAIAASIRLWVTGVLLFATSSLSLARLDFSHIAIGKVAASVVSMAALLAIWFAFVHLMKEKVYPLPILLLTSAAVILEVFIDAGEGMSAKRQLVISLFRAGILFHLVIVVGNVRKADDKTRHPVICAILLFSVIFIGFHALYFAESIFHLGIFSLSTELDEFFRSSTYGVTIVPMLGFVTVFLERHREQLTNETTRAEKLHNLYEITRQCNQAIARLHNRKELLNKIAQICVEHASVDLVWIGSPGEDGWLTYEAVAGKASNYIDGLKISVDENLPEGRGGTGTSLRTRKPVIYNQFGTSDAWHGRRKLYGISSGATFPLWDRKNRISCITLYSTEQNFFTEERAALLSGLAEDLGNALTAIEIRRLRAEALRHVRANRRLLNFALNSASDATWEWHIATGVVVFSRRWREMLGYTEIDLANSIEAW